MDRVRKQYVIWIKSKHKVDTTGWEKVKCWVSKSWPGHDPEGGFGVIFIIKYLKKKSNDVIYDVEVYVIYLRMGKGDQKFRLIV